LRSDGASGADICIWPPSSHSLSFWAIWAGSILTRAVDLTVLKSRVQEKDDEQEDRYNGYVGHGASMFGRRLMRCARFATHIELENTGNHDHGLRPIAVLKHRKPKRLGTIGEEPAAKAARVLNNPVPPAILADQKKRRSRTRERRGLSHGD
jgi:hypothetical protein